jgi:ATP-dependent Clp protease adaptor protein ClpS
MLSLFLYIFVSIKKLPMHIFETEELEDVIVLDDTERMIVLHNDDYNTFDWVIECLINICKHFPEQAEQCAYLTHYTGKSEVKKGPESVLRKMYMKLKSAGLTVTLD